MAIRYIWFMPPKKLIIALMCALSTTNVFSQFYTELFSANQQIYRAVDKSGQDSVFTYNHFVNVLLPIVRKNQDASLSEAIMNDYRVLAKMDAKQ